LSSEKNQIEDKLRELYRERENARKELSSLQYRKSMLSVNTEDHAVEARKIEKDVSKVESRVKDLEGKIEKHEANLKGIPAKIEKHNDVIKDLRQTIERLEGQVGAIQYTLNEKKSAEVSVKQHLGITDGQLKELRRQIAELSSTINRIREHAEQVAGQYKSHLAGIRYEQEKRIERTKELQHQAARALSDYEQCRIDAEGLTKDISSIEQVNANLSKSLTDNRDISAQQLAELHKTASLTERERVQFKRLRQEVDLNIDLLLTMLKCLTGPTPEAKRVLGRMEAA
jgi:chromosome segregation ATPase